jgi:exocyst complex component 4
MSNIDAREVKLEMDLLGEQPLVESQLIHSTRKLEALGNLAESLVCILLLL